MKKWWWKILGVMLVTYALIAGMLVPLKPGLLSVTPSMVEVGEEIMFSVTGYNFHFDKAEKNIAYLRIKDNLLLPDVGFDAIDYNRANIKFLIPSKIPVPDSIISASLIVNNEIDGSAVIPSSIFLKKRSEPSTIDINYPGFITNPENLMEVDTFRYPYRSILNETIRNTFFHVTLWFSMFIMLIAGLYYAIQYLRTKNLDDDHKSKSLTVVSILYGILGLVTGSIWAKHTWGTWWTTDVKLNMAAVAMLIYAAYLILRGSIRDQDQQARLASAYNIFAFVALIPLVFVIPRLTDSLHPGNGGNPALGGEDLDNTLRMVFYPAIIGFTLIGVWLATLYYRMIIVKEKILLK